MILVIEKTSTDEDYQGTVTIEEKKDDLPPRTIFNVFDGEPEDNTLGRNFNDCNQVAALLEKFYNYGKSGVVVEFAYDEVSPEDH
jgi:hypothetical protein